MNELRDKTEKIIELLGFTDFRVESSQDAKNISVFISDDVSMIDLPVFVGDLNRLVRQMVKTESEPRILIDVNNYRREREKLIVEIAKAAARKAVTTKTEITLPPMNAYERMLVHSELAIRPDVKTESVGEGRNRYVVVKAIED